MPEILTTYRDAHYHTAAQWDAPITATSTDELLRQRIPAGTQVKCLSQNGDRLVCKYRGKLINIHREAFVKRRKR